MKILICIQYVAYILRIDFDIVTIIWTIIYDKLCNFCAGKNGFSLYEVKVVDLVVTLYFEHLVRFHLIGSSKRSCVSPPRQVFNVPIEPCDGASFNLLLPFFYLPSFPNITDISSNHHRGSSPLACSDSDRTIYSHLLHAQVSDFRPAVSAGGRCVSVNFPLMPILGRL